MKVTDLKENEVIHCKTKGESKRICRLMHEAGLRWCSDRSYLKKDDWDYYEEDTCYQPYAGQSSDLDYFNSEGFTIHDSTLFTSEESKETNSATQLGDRFNSGKPQWHLVDFDALESMVRVMEYGEEKYGADNWKKGQNYSTLIDCLLRHTFALLRGEEVDTESGVHHVGHLQANAMMLAYMIQHRPDLNDLAKSNHSVVETRDN